MDQEPTRHQTASTSKLTALRDRNRPLFSLGHIVATAGVHHHIVTNDIDPAPYIRQHHCGLWGGVPPEDAQENDLSVLMNGFRVLSSYEIGGKRVWAITEADRSSTTLLFPSEY
jgi:hypothetical protein